MFAFFRFLETLQFKTGVISCRKPLLTTTCSPPTQLHPTLGVQEKCPLQPLH